MHLDFFCVNRTVAKALFCSIYRIRVEKEWEDSEGRAAVILPKHQYWTDIPLVGLSFDERLYFVAKSELFRWPGVGMYLRWLGGVPLDRQKPIRTLSSFRCLRFLLESQRKIVIFPEGTYFRGVLGPGRSGLIGMVLKIQSRLKLNIPFIPVGICYGDRKGLRRDIDIRVGPPIFAREPLDGMVLARQLMGEIGRLSGILTSFDRMVSYREDKYAEARER